MLKGEVKCINLNCCSCPFTSEARLRFCTRFKLNETLFAGLEINKNHMSPKDYFKAYDKLNKEVTDKDICDSTYTAVRIIKK